MTAVSASKLLLLVLVAGLGSAALLAADGSTASARTCTPTRPNEPLNPNYRPKSPVRSSVGKGYVLAGVVRSRDGCRPIARARLEFFHGGADGQYSARPSWAGRATVVARRDGTFSFGTSFPGAAAGNGFHIHVHITAPGFRPLNTTYFPRAAETQGRLAPVLVPAG